MRNGLLILCLFLAAGTSAQSNPKAVVRQQTFGVYSSYTTFEGIKFDSGELVIFSNGYKITRDEFLVVFRGDSLSDTSNAAKTAYLKKYILNYQKAFEAMDQGLDTTTQFQLDYLTYKQGLITPYLNEGKTRLEAEALPEVKYALRRYYADKLVRILMNKEVWAPQTDAVLQEFYYDHLSLYQGQPFEISKTKVIYDQQKEKETDLMQRINTKFLFKINEDLQRKL